MSNGRHPRRSPPVAILFTLMATLFLLLSPASHADETVPPATVPQAPLGRFLTLPSPLTETALATLQNSLVALRDRATAESRPAVLVLEIAPGSSRPGLIRDTLNLLMSAEYSSVRLAAWVPAPLNGNQTVLALACHEIILHPQASLGNIGRGQPTAADDQQFYQTLGDSRRNPGLSRGVIRAMLENSSGLYRVRIRDVAGLEQTRLLAADELQTLRQQPLEILDTVIIREAGNPTQFTAEDCQRFGILSRQTAKNRPEVAELLRLPQESLREDSTVAPRSARLLQIHGAIGMAMGDFARREIRRARAEKVGVLIVEIDSPGGSKDIAEDLALLLSDIPPEDMQTIAWIPRRALSGGALIAFGCEQVVLHPDAQIGDIGVIGQIEPGGQFERAPEKIVSPFLEFAATLARKRGRPPALLQAMIDRDLEVFQVTSTKTGAVTWMSEPEIGNQPEEWVKGPLVPETRKGLLLTLGGRRANELRLAAPPCQDLTELRQRLGLPPEVLLPPIRKTWVDGLVAFLNSGFGAFLLVAAGILCIYIEAHMPSGLFAIPSIICFSLFFWSRFLGGTAGTLELVLFLLGLALLAVEIFLIPGFGVFGVSGILLTLASLVMASQTFSGISTTRAFDETVTSLTSILGALMTVVVAAILLNRFLPSIPFFNRLILAPPGSPGYDGPRLNPALLASHGIGGPVQPGESGVTLSSLRPAGRVRFGDRYVNVVSEGGWVNADVPVEVVEVAGNRIVVRPCPPGPG
ncbi:MAG: NfeD family protein [Planctomycetota bacterium]